MPYYLHNLFRHRAWMSTIIYWTGLIFFIFSCYNSNILLWWPYIILLYIAGTITISVGYHRLFCHRSFRCNSFWHIFFATSGVAYMYGSPAQWAATHTTHHKHSDTLLDPHPPRKLSALFFKSYRSVPINVFVIRKLFRQNKFHKFIDQYYLIIYLIILLTLLILSIDFILWCYLPALGIAHLIGSLHNYLSHKNSSPKNLWLFEYLIPTSGEWLHLNHHNKPGKFNFDTKWYHFDLGKFIVYLIKSKHKNMKKYV